MNRNLLRKEIIFFKFKAQFTVNFWPGTPISCKNCKFLWLVQLQLPGGGAGVQPCIWSSEEMVKNSLLALYSVHFSVVLLSILLLQLRPASVIHTAPC